MSEVLILEVSPEGEQKSMVESRAIYLKELCQLGDHYVPVADWSNPIT